MLGKPRAGNPVGQRPRDAGRVDRVGIASEEKTSAQR